MKKTEQDFYVKMKVRRHLKQGRKRSECEKGRKGRYKNSFVTTKKLHVTFTVKKTLQTVLWDYPEL